MCKEEMTHGHKVIQPGKKKSNNAIFREIYKLGIINYVKIRRRKIQLL